MGKFTASGPDWADVCVTMSAIGEIHQVDVSLTMSPDGGRAAGCLELTVLAWRRSAHAGGLPRSVSRKCPFPNSRNQTIEGTAYNLLYELDKDCTSMWEQKQLQL